MSETKTTQTTSVAIPTIRPAAERPAAERPSDGYVLARQVNSLELQSVQKGFTEADIPFREEECETDEGEYGRRDVKLFVPKEYLKQAQKLMYTLLDFVPLEIPEEDRPPDGHVFVRRVTAFEMPVMRTKFKKSGIPYHEKECKGDTLDLGRSDTNIFVMQEHVEQARNLLYTMYPQHNYSPTRQAESDEMQVFKWMIPIILIGIFTPWSSIPTAGAYLLGALLLAFPIGALIVYWVSTQQ